MNKFNKLYNCTINETRKKYDLRDFQYFIFEIVNEFFETTTLEYDDMKSIFSSKVSSIITGSKFSREHYKYWDYLPSKYSRGFEIELKKLISRAQKIDPPTMTHLVVLVPQYDEEGKIEEYNKTFSDIALKTIENIKKGHTYK